MRILLDYRTALRQRTGVGEYAHQMAAALARQATPGDRVVLFSSSWKDRLPSNAIPGTETVDRRVPVTLLNAAWHRLERPAIETLAGDVDDPLGHQHPERQRRDGEQHRRPVLGDATVDADPDQPRQHQLQHRVQPDQADAEREPVRARLLNGDACWASTAGCRGNVGTT